MATPVRGMALLQEAAGRIVTKHLVMRGAARAEIARTEGTAQGRDIDIITIEGRSGRRIKLKADPYFGTDPRKIGDRSLAFYRVDEGCLAFEAVANSATREPGWALVSDAQDLYYYYLALGQTEDEVRALLSEPDEVFFSELAVERDELLVLPMDALRAWFEANYQDYVPRPVMSLGVASWHRLVPRADLVKALGRVSSAGPIFAKLPR